MRIKSIEGVTTGNLFRVPLDLLNEEPGFNERDYDAPEVQAQIRKFADAYKAGEFVPNLVIRNSGETIYIVEGHLRRRGALLAVAEGAEIASLPCTQFTGNDADRIAFMVASSQGLPLNPVGRARAYLRLNRLGLSPTEIAAKVGQTPQSIGQYLILAEANTDVQQAVHRNDISFTMAVGLVKQHGDNAGKVIAEKVAAAEAKNAALPTPSAPRRRAKVTKKAVAGGSADQPLVKAALALVTPHLDTLKKGDLSGVSVMVSGTDLLALLNALPTRVGRRAKKSA